MVDTTFIPQFFCGLCKQGYPTLTKAERCEALGFKPAYQLDKPVRVSGSPNLDGWIPTAGGGNVRLEGVENNCYFVEQIYMRKEIHEPMYLLREDMKTEQRALITKQKERLAKMSVDDAHPDDLNHLVETARLANDEEFIKDYDVRLLLPEDCIASVPRDPAC